jgi:hypothetical protein
MAGHQAMMGTAQKVSTKQVVEVPGIEPGSFGIKTGLLRA